MKEKKKICPNIIPLMKEQWGYPELEIEQFVPQEYVAACYTVKLTCIANSDYSYMSVNGKNETHINGGPHSKSIDIKSQSSPDLNYLSNNNYITSATAGKNNGHRTDNAGYAWQDNNQDWHFIPSNNASNYFSVTPTNAAS